MSQTHADKAANKNVQRSASTRAALIASGTKLFGEHGYADVGTEQIVKTAKVTRGALYHHFKDKQDLFRAVFEDVERGTVEQIAARITATTDPWKLAIDGAMIFLDLCLDPAFQRIVIVDAPSVLGSAEYREIADRYGGAMIEAMLTALIEAGEVEAQPVKPLARLLTGALVEGGVWIANADDEALARGEVGAAIEQLLKGLKAQ